VVSRERPPAVQIARRLRPWFPNLHHVQAVERKGSAREMATRNSSVNIRQSHRQRLAHRIQNAEPPRPKAFLGKPW
jgi:hypothetical protein